MMIQKAGQGNPGPASCKRQVGVSQSSSCVSQHNPSAPGRQASTCNTCESTHGPCRLGEHPYKPLSPACKHVCLSICLCLSFWCERLVSPRPLGVVPVKATKATFQGWRALRWGSPTALDGQREACCPLEHGQCTRHCIPSPVTLLGEANEGCTETVTNKTRTTAGLLFERAIFGVSNLRTQERHFTQPASQPALLGPASCFRRCAFLCVSV